MNRGPKYRCLQTFMQSTILGKGPNLNPEFILSLLDSVEENRSLAIKFNSSCNVATTHTHTHTPCYLIISLQIAKICFIPAETFHCWANIETYTHSFQLHFHQEHSHCCLKPFIATKRLDDEGSMVPSSMFCFVFHSCFSPESKMIDSWQSGFTQSIFVILL